MQFGSVVGAALAIGLSAAVWSAYREKNELISEARGTAKGAADGGVAHLLGVGWHPTPAAAAAAALSWAGVAAGDVVYELGCGDGVVALEAVRLGASAICVELDPERAAVAEAALVGSRAKVVIADLFDIDLSDATVVYTFLLPAMNARLRTTTFGTLKRPGVRVIAREFDIVGWPCGARFRHSGVKFIKWELPVASSGGGDTAEREAFDESAAVEHMLECNAEESVTESLREQERSQERDGRQLDRDPQQVEEQDAFTGNGIRLHDG